MYKKGDSTSAIEPRFDGSGFGKHDGIFVFLPFFIIEQDGKGPWVLDNVSGFDPILGDPMCDGSLKGRYQKYQYICFSKTSHPVLRCSVSDHDFY